MLWSMSFTNTRQEPMQHSRKQRNFSSLPQAVELLSKIKLDGLEPLASEVLQFLKTSSLQRYDYGDSSRSQELSSDIWRRCRLKRFEVPAKKPATISTLTDNETDEKNTITI